MIQIIKNKEAVLVFAIGLAIIFCSVFTINKMASPITRVSAATETIAVTATVSEWISFSVSPTTTSLSPNLVDTSGNTAVASSSNITLVCGTNDDSGFNIQIREDNNDGLISGANSINLASATGTLVAGTDGYGVNATTTSSNTSIATNYNYWSTTTVGQITNTAQNLSTCSDQIASSTTTMKIYAACDSLQPSGSYTDTITVTCAGAS